MIKQHTITINYISEPILFVKKECIFNCTLTLTFKTENKVINVSNPL